MGDRTGGGISGFNAGGFWEDGAVTFGGDAGVGEEDGAACTDPTPSKTMIPAKKYFTIFPSDFIKSAP